MDITLEFLQHSRNQVQIMKSTAIGTTSLSLLPGIFACMSKGDKRIFKILRNGERQVSLYGQTKIYDSARKSGLQGKDVDGC